MNRDRALSLFNQFHTYVALIEKESDRGAVIVGVSILDDLVREAIGARLVPSLERDDELLEGGSAPCSTLSAKIDLAYRIGAITMQMRSSLHLLRKMRNDAAHVGQHRDFESPELRNRLRELLRLNRGLIEITWSTIPPPEGAGKAAAPTTDDTVAAFIDQVGWRTAWNHFISLLAAALSVVPEATQQLKSLDQQASPKQP